MNIKTKISPMCFIAVIFAGCADDDVSHTPRPQPSDNNTVNNTNNIDVPDGSNNDTNHSNNQLPPDDNNAQTTCEAQCDEPPAATCINSRARQYYDPQASCDEQGQCLYTEHQERCDSPPATTCLDSETLRAYRDDGVCANGACYYGKTDQRCDQPPTAPSCEDNVETSWDEIPRCEQAQCVYQMKQTDCGLNGCCEDGCCELVASGNEQYGDFSATIEHVTPPDDAFFDTDMQCNSTGGMGTCSVVESANACVCKANNFTINDLRVLGSRQLVLLANQTITVKGHLNASAYDRHDNTSGAPGSRPSPQAAATGHVGGQGGSYAGLGGGAEDTADHDMFITPLVGGTAGQSACGALGGAGGGAIQLSAKRSITINGVISANGAGGQGGDADPACNGGAGGGSGGAILIEAPDVFYTGKLFANGGGGGSGGGPQNNGLNGSDGGLGSVSRAHGGSPKAHTTCTITDHVLSGEGGDGSASGSASPEEINGRPGSPGQQELGCAQGPIITGAGGGGGGAGHIRILSTRLDTCRCNGESSPLVGRQNIKLN